MALLRGTNFNDEIYGAKGSDAIYGYGGDDLVLALSGNDRVYGGSGSDALDGGAGRDLINGSSGNDLLAGGFGIDTLTGGSGQDGFLFDTKPALANMDVITDFNVHDDTIYLDKAAFKKVGRDGTLSKAAFFIGAEAHDATDRIIYDKTTGALYYDADGTGPAAQIQFAQMKAGLALTRADFYIF